MGSKGRMPPPHLMRHPLHGPGMVHPEPFGAGMRPLSDRFPPMDMLPPPEILERKLAVQHVEMEKLATENRRLATTHGTLRQQLAAAQQELQILESQIESAKVEREQQMRALVERIGKMEAELRAAERLKIDLQQARTEAQSLAEVRQELISRVQQLSNELQRAHTDAQQIPALLSELNHLGQEFHQCRITYERERKVYHDHLESLQVMDKDYRAMADEVAKLRAELSNPATADKRAAYGAAGYGESDASGYNPPGQSSYEEAYGLQQQAHSTYPASGSAPTAPVAAAAAGGSVINTGSTPPYGVQQSAPAAARGGYNMPRVPGYEPQRPPAYDASRVPAYDPQGAQAYNSQRVQGYDPYNRGVSYDPRSTPYDPQRAGGYEFPRGASYDANSRGAPAPPPSGQAPANNNNNMPYGSTAPPAARSGTGHESQATSGNATRR